MVSRCPRLVPVVAALLSVVATVTSVQGVARAAEPRRAGVAEALEAVVAAGAPGALASASDRRGTHTVVRGVADVQTRRPVPERARFRVASLTKSVVATVVLQLVEERRLRLDAPVGTWLPGVVDGADSITVRQLLDHTGGLGDYVDHAEFADPTVYGRRTYRTEQLVGYAEHVGPAGPPGGAFHYSNAGYVVLGLLVERVTGHRLADELARRLFEPLGMTHTYLPGTERRLPRPHATGYYLPPGADPDDPGSLVPVTELNPSFAWAAYGLVSDARDMNRFYRALFAGRLLGPLALRQMREGVPTPQAPVFPRYGLGLEAVDLTCGRFWGATGSIPGYQTLTFASGSGARALTVSMNVQRNDPAAGTMILAAVDTLNRYLCGEPYELPPGVPELRT